MIPEENTSLVDLALALDHEGMIDFTRAFVEDLRKGFNHVTLEQFEWLESLCRQRWAGVLCLGMGGSGVGGEFLSGLAQFQGKMPVHVQRDYSAPAWWTPAWLVLATSHSGNTEETLEATETVLKAGATVVVLFQQAVFLLAFPNSIPIATSSHRSAVNHLEVHLDTCSADKSSSCVI